MVNLRHRMLLGVLTLLIAAAARPGAGDPHFGQQWGLHRIRAPEAWSVSQGEGVVVAVLDSGVDLTHPDLAGALARRADGSVLGYDFVDGDADPMDEHGHGTMVAGIIAARNANGTGVASVAPRARIMPVRVLDSHALGPNSSVEEGIRWAVDQGAHVINLSLEIAREVAGATEPAVPASSSPDWAVRYAWSRGVAVVAAAGNDSADFTDYPPGSPVLLVGAAKEHDERAAFSDARSDAVMAPGVNIVSTWCLPCGAHATHRIGQSDGTSYAAAHVTGAVALLRAAGYSGAEAVMRLRLTAEDMGASGPDSRTGHGRIDVAAALGLPSPHARRGTGRNNLVPPETGPAAASSPLDPGAVLDPPATNMAGAVEEPAAAVGMGHRTDPVRSWALLAAALLVANVAALWLVTVREQFR